LGLYYLTGDSQAQANVNASMAQSWLELADLPKAENCLIKALRIVENLPNQSNLAWVLGNYGDFLMAAGKNDEALIQYKKALAINSVSGEQMAITGDYIRLAAFYKAAGNQKEMQHYISLGLQCAEDCNNLRDIEKLKSIGR
jgi:tetratricopeptide (TPR) repeat protein